MTVPLSRLLITGALTRNTPLCVLEEVCLTHGFDVDIIGNQHNGAFMTGLIETINTTPMPLYHDGHSTTLQRFVNPLIEWPSDQLNLCFLELYAFMNDYNYTLPANYELGLPLPYHTNQIGACVLYRCCRQQRFPLTRNTTIREMNQMLFPHLPLPAILTSPSIPLREGNEDDLIIPHCQRPQHNNDKDIIDDLFNISLLRRWLTPASKREAIILAGLEFQLNINDKEDPIRMYEQLLQGFEPPYMWMMRYDHHFDGRMPEVFYDHAGVDLFELASSYGYSELELEDPRDCYDLLIVAELLSSFYQCVPGNIINTNTPIYMTQVDTILPEELIYFGVSKDQIYQAITIDELRELFNHRKAFVNPFDDYNPLTEIQKQRLRCLMEIILPWDTEKSVVNKRLLISEIELVELFNDDNMKKAREMVDTYQKTNEQQQQLIIQCLQDLFHLSMAMRGHIDVNDPYPIINAPVSNQYLVDVEVTQLIKQFESSDNQVNNIIGDLPLLRYNNGFEVSNEESDGFTISNRIDIVKSGESIASCIRLSSNWLATSVFRYMVLIGIPEPFDIKDLRHIS